MRRAFLFAISLFLYEPCQVLGQNQAPVYGPEALSFTNQGNQWVPKSWIRRQADSRGNTYFTCEVAFGSPQDTLVKTSYAYDSLGRAIGYQMFRKALSGALKPDQSIQVRYNAQGVEAHHVRMAQNTTLEIFDTTTIYKLHTCLVDSRGRPIFLDYSRTQILYDRRFPQGDTLRTRISMRWQDSLFYQTPTSKFRAGFVRYQQAAGGQFLPADKELYTFTDTLRGIIGKRDHWHWTSGTWEHSWHMEMRNTRPDWYQTRYESYQSGNLLAWSRSDFRVDDRIQFDWLKQYGYFDWSIWTQEGPRNVVFRRDISSGSNLTDPATLSLVDDSVGIDANGRLLAIAYFSENTWDTSRAATTQKSSKLVYTQQLPTQLRPSPAPQTLAIAPGPSTNTALIVNLSQGSWQATLVDMQGRSTPLSSPDRSGILAMPNLATGVYCLHLKNDRGRHLHGRFAWER